MWQLWAGAEKWDLFRQNMCFPSLPQSSPLPVALLLKLDNHLLLKTDCGVLPQSFYVNGLWVGLIICISNKFPGDTDVATPGTHL